ELFHKLFPRIKVGDRFGTQTPQALQFRTLAERVFHTGEPALLNEVEAELPDGREPLWFDLLLHPVRDEAGAIDAVVIVGTNVTAVVAGRRALDEQAEHTRQAEARLSALLDPGPFSVVSHDASGRLRHSAGRQLAQLGLQPGGVLREA